MIDEIVKYLKGKGVSYEIYYVNSDKLNVEVRMNDIASVSSGAQEGFGIRVVKEGKMGFSSTNNCNNFKDCVDSAIRIAKLSEKDKDFKNFFIGKKISKVKTFDEKLNLEVEDCSELVDKFVDDIKSVEKAMDFAEGSAMKEIEDIRIINSEGVDFGEKRNKLLFGGTLSLLKKGKMDLFDETVYDREVLDFDGKKLAEEFLNCFDAKDIKPGNYQVVMKTDALASLFSNTFAFAVNAENVHKNKSIWFDKMGQEVGNKKLNVLDNPLKENTLGVRSADDEGAPSQKTRIIEKGVLRSFLYDSYYANLEGKESTGNASRDFSSVPSIEPANLMVERGGKVDLIKELDRGIVVRDILGAHTVDTGTGNFSLGVEKGYYVENGEIKNPIKNVMIAGNFFNLLKEIQEISCNCKARTGELGGGIYVPDMMFPEIRVIS